MSDAQPARVDFELENQSYGGAQADGEEGRRAAGVGRTARRRRRESPVPCPADRPSGRRNTSVHFPAEIQCTIRRRRERKECLNLKALRGRNELLDVVEVSERVTRCN